MWFNRRRAPRIHDELQFHRDRLIDDYVARGMSRPEAERRAFLEFGSVAATEESVKDVRGRWLDDLGRDIRCGARTLRRNPGFAATAAATLALAIGISTAMFSVLNAVVLRPLPYASPDQLVMLWTEDPTQNLREGRSSLGTVQQWRTLSRSFADIATFDAMSTTLSGPEGAEQIPFVSISHNLLSLLGVKPVQGRSFSTQEAEQRERLVIISHRFWQARFGGSNGAVGATIELNGRPFQIIGILPDGFQIGRLDADVWWSHPMSGGGGAETWFAVGRLRSTVTFEQAQAEMSAIARGLNEQSPVAGRNRGIAVVPLSLYLVGAESRLALWMLGGAVAFVFLIAAANVTSLSLARGIARAREMVIRTAVGAGAGRIVRQMLTESVMLAIVSGLIGTLLALVGIRLIRAVGPATLPGLNEIGLDLRALGWALGMSLTAGILVGLAPAIATLRRDLRASGEESGRSVSGGAATRGIRRVLVLAEFAAAIVLLVGAGLLVRSWWHVTGVDSGFAPDRVLVMEISTPAAFNVPAQRSDLYRRVLEQIQAVPGVQNAGIIGDLFIQNSREQLVTIERDDGTVSERMRLQGDEVSADFFKAAGTPLLRGRFFSVGDGPDAPRVAIINEAMARRAWPGDDPVGRRLKPGPPDSDRPWVTVVGVVTDMRRQGPERETVPQMFVSLAQDAPRSADILIRTSSDDPLAMAGLLRAAVRRVERNAPIYGVAPLERQLGAYLTQRRFQTLLLTGFSIVALLMAAVGIYGLIQYSVATRTQEIGVRQALGAPAGDIFRMILGEGLMLSLTGLALGLVGAWGLGRVGSSLLFGVTAGDPLTFMAVSLLLTAVAVAASYLPARRAMRVAPIVALRA
jgi:putative ABC transport system permease protein